MALLSSKKRTLESLVLDINSKHEKTNDTNSVHSDNQQKKRRNFTKHHHHLRGGPPLIPPSPKTKPDSSSQTELKLKQFDLELANESWLEHTMKKSEFTNGKAMKEKMSHFGLNTVKSEYQSLIKHTNINFKQITELMEEGNSMHIVSQVADIGCPLVKNPNAKRGCWCIEHYKKQKKQIANVQILQNSQSQTANNMMEYLRMKSALKHKAATSTATTASAVQNNLILHARSQQYVTSNRMQQIRMQQMLLSARTGPNSLSATTTNATTIKPNLTKVRTHKDTIVFNNNNNDTNGQPPAKRRKKSRFGSK